MAHPRVRGEHVQRRVQATSRGGSSPRPRGARCRFDLECLTPGLIPASAGSTVFAIPAFWRSWAHPRVRGEHRLPPPPSGVDGGSSPRPRGARLRMERWFRMCGLIPASAGSTIRPDESVVGRRAHPRVRGEHMGRWPATPNSPGSSPLPRGALVRPRHDAPPRGLIPASAGSTARHRPAVAQLGAHPRVRGEHGEELAGRGDHQGSSPRPRGALATRAWAAVQWGLIPASAGSTVIV